MKIIAYDYVQGDTMEELKQKMNEFISTHSNYELYGNVVFVNTHYVQVMVVAWEPQYGEST